MRINRFWVVVEPSPLSTLVDICFQTTPAEFIYYARGGDVPTNVAIYDNQFQAEQDARARLEGQDPQARN